MTGGGYLLEKAVWDDGDFERMGWHDATVHAIAFGPELFELSFDLDYPFEWVRPAEGECDFQFWIAPCTLVFENVYDLRLATALTDGWAFEIADLVRSRPRRPENAAHVGRETEWRWTLQGHDGDISFWSVGFRQFVRRRPILSSAQRLQPEERGGISFGRELEEA